MSQPKSPPRRLFQRQMITLKTKNAFALQNFDKNKILQRPFFKDLTVDGAKIFSDNMTDEENLQNLFSADSIESKEISRQAYKIIYSAVEDYQKKILRHKFRIEIFIGWITRRLVKTSPSDIEELKRLQDYHERTEKIWEKYSDIAKSIEDFSLLVSTETAMLDAIISKHYREIFSEKLKSARKSARLTQKELAEKIGVSDVAVTQYERKLREPSISTAMRLAKALNISLDVLCGL